MAGLRVARKVGEVAQLFARVEPEFPVGYFLRQVKHYAQLGLISAPLRGPSGRTSPAKYGPREVCAAYLLSNLTRLGLKAETLRYIARYFGYLQVRLSGPNRRYLGSLGEVIRDTEAGKRWFLVVSIVDWSESESWERRSVDAEFRESTDVGAEAALARAVVVLDCLHLLGPLLNAMRAEEGSGPSTFGQDGPDAFDESPEPTPDQGGLRLG